MVTAATAMSSAPTGQGSLSGGCDWDGTQAFGVIGHQSDVQELEDYPLSTDRRALGLRAWWPA